MGRAPKAIHHWGSSERDHPHERLPRGLIVFALVLAAWLVLLAAGFIAWVVLT